MKTTHGTRLTVIALVLVLLCSCVNPYSTFYTDRLGGRKTEQIPEFVSSDGNPRLYSGSDVEADSLRMIEEGFDLIGYSCFSASTAKSDDAKSHAEDVGAQVVLVYSKYSHTDTGTSIVSVPNPPVRSTTYASGSAFGSGGFSTFYGSATTTTSGGYSTYTMPYSIDRYDFGATYWIKKRPPVLGVTCRDLSENERKQWARNRGAVVIAVIKRSPAHVADVLRGDVILRIGGYEISDSFDLIDQLDRQQGNQVDVELLRDGRSLTKRVSLGRQLGIPGRLGP